MKYIILFITIFSIINCSPITSLHNANGIGKGKYEITPLYSNSSLTVNDSVIINTSYYGIQTSFGLNNNNYFCLGLKRIYNNYEQSFTQISLSLNLGDYNEYTLLNKSSVYLQIYLTKEDKNDEIHKIFKPTIIHTFSFGKQFEINPSIKFFIPIHELSDGGQYINFYLQYAFNLGFGISSNLNKWALRPEIGVLKFYGNNEIQSIHTSIGLSIYP